VKQYLKHICTEKCNKAAYENFVDKTRMIADPSGRAVRGSSVAGVAGSNRARRMGVCLLCLYAVLSCVGRSLCVGLITRPEGPYVPS
jgi:hypothetical protein